MISNGCIIFHCTDVIKSDIQTTVFPVLGWIPSHGDTVLQDTDIFTTCYKYLSWSSMVFTSLHLLQQSLHVPIFPPPLPHCLSLIFFLGVIRSQITASVQWSCCMNIYIFFYLGSGHPERWCTSLYSHWRVSSNYLLAELNRSLQVTMNVTCDISNLVSSHPG